MIIVYKVNKEFLGKLKEKDVFFKEIQDFDEIDTYCVIVSEKPIFLKNKFVLDIIRPDLIKVLKWDLRFKVWRAMERSKVISFPKDIYGRIPNFYGARDAAERLLEIEDFLNAKVVLVNPDAPQRPVRELVLRLGKTLVMPTPRLKGGFLLIRGKDIFREASTIRGAFRYGKKIEELPKIDFIVEGSVAVDKEGYRLGKGSGYGDLEIKLAKRKNPNVKIATTVHELQIVSKVPREAHDERMNYIVTPKKIIKVQ